MTKDDILVGHMAEMPIKQDAMVEVGGVKNEKEVFK